MSFASRGWLLALPGLLLAGAVAAAARYIHGWMPERPAALVGEVIIAVLLGLAIGNVMRLPPFFSAGIRFSFHTVLRLAIVLLGARFSAQQVAAIGGKALIMILVLMTMALLAAHLLGRLAGVSDKLATLIGVGTAVCGNSAITATAPVIGAKDEDVSFAVATNTLFGTLAVFAYPVIGHWAGFSDAAFGTWAGTAVNDTSQVVATGFAFSEGAGRIATAVKLTRNALMGAVIVLMGFLYGRSGEGAGRRDPFLTRLKQSMPLFVVGFLLMALLNSLGAFSWASGVAGRDVTAGLQEAAQALILVALAGVGLGTRMASLRRIGLRPFYVGLATALTTSLASLALIRVLGPAGGR